MSPTATHEAGRSPRRSGGSGPTIRATRSSWSPSRAAPASPSRPWSGWMRSSVERAVLLAPALSPGYDLTARAAGRAPGDRRLLVAAGRGDPGRGDPVVRHDRSRPDRRRGPGGFRGARPRRTRRGAAGASTRSSARSAGGPGWRDSAISAATVGPDSPRFLRKYVVPLLRADDAAERRRAESRFGVKPILRSRRYPNGPGIAGLMA